MKNRSVFFCSAFFSVKQFVFKGSDLFFYETDLCKILGVGFIPMPWSQVWWRQRLPGFVILLKPWVWNYPYAMIPGWWMQRLSVFFIIFVKTQRVALTLCPRFHTWGMQRWHDGMSVYHVILYVHDLVDVAIALNLYCVCVVSSV